MSAGGLNGVMIEYDSFFNGKREKAEMMQAFKESRDSL